MFRNLLQPSTTHSPRDPYSLERAHLPRLHREIIATTESTLEMDEIRRIYVITHPFSTPIISLPDVLEHGKISITH